MKLSCEIYEDLLLLYEDGLCSEDTKKLVEEHLAGCTRCSQYLRKMRLPDEMIQEETAQEEPEEDARAEKESIRKSFRKIRRRWAMSLLVIPLLLLLTGPGIMIANEVRGEGICFSNLDDIWKCHRFWKLMADGKYEKAVEMLDFSNKYVNVRETIAGNTHDGRIEEVRQIYIDVYGDVLNMTQDEFERQEQQKIAAYLRENQPVMLRRYSYDNSYTYKSGSTWAIGYELVEGVQHPDKVGMSEVRYDISIDVTEDGLIQVGASIPENYLRDEYGGYVYDEEGNLIELWNAREELVFYRVFDISTDEVVKKIYEWYQSQEQ